MKYYVVIRGKSPGIYKTWDECKNQVDGYPNNKYKSFKTLSEAEQYLVENDVDIDIIDIDEKQEMGNTITKPENQILVSENQKRIKIYTDGSCKDNIGGFGYVQVSDGKDEYPVNGKVPIYPCTNQKAELYAIYKAIQNCDSNRIDIYTDSMYSLKCLTEWYHNWKQNGWKTANNKPVENKLIIQHILNLMLNKDVKFYHIYSHTGNKYNEWADKLANEGRLCE